MARPAYVWSGTEWVPVGPVTPTSPFHYQATPPSSPANGDVWVDSDGDLDALVLNAGDFATQTQLAEKADIDAPTFTGTVNLPETTNYDGTQLSTTLASKVDYALPVNTQTGTTYTFVAADAEKLTTASNAAAVTLTIPPQSSVTWSDNTVLRVVNYGAGAVTVAGGSGVTVTNTATTLAQYESAAAIRTGSDAWTLVPFGSKPAPSIVEYLVVAGGGSGGWGTSVYPGGGGGGGGYRSSIVSEGSGGGNSTGQAPITVSPNTSYTITVGGGGAASIVPGGVGNPGTGSSFSTVFTVGGGRGGVASNGTNGGSGGGAGGWSGNTRSGGSGTADEGFAGASGTTGQGGGGAGGAASGTTGGIGVSSSITGSSITRSVGGNGTTGARTDGAVNTGNGGSGGSNSGSIEGGSGGKGVVVIRHSNKLRKAVTSGSPVVTDDGTNITYQFNDSGTIEWVA